MGKMLRIFLIVSLFFLVTSNAQNIRVNLEINPGITQLNLGSLIVDENLSGTPRLFRISIFPEQRKVKLKGWINWKPINKSLRQVASFETEEFLSRSFSNQALNDGRIKIARTDENSDVINDLRKYGKLTGTVEIRVLVTDVVTGQTAEDTKRIDFTNPAQTLKVLSPNPGSVEDVGNVIARWDRIPGAKSYKITLIQKKSKEQSDIEALSSGKPLIKDKDVGKTNQVNLRTLLERQWTPGMELVFQVKAVTDAPGGVVELPSDPTSFFIEDPNDETKDIVDPEALLDLILNGDLRLDQIKYFTIDGKRVEPHVLMRLIQQLKNNPNLIVNKRFLGKSGRE